MDRDELVDGLRRVQRHVLDELGDRRAEVARLEQRLAVIRGHIEDHRFDLGMLEQELRGHRR